MIFFLYCYVYNKTGVLIFFEIVLTQEASCFSEITHAISHYIAISIVFDSF